MSLQNRLYGRSSACHRLRYSIGRSSARLPTDRYFTGSIYVRHNIKNIIQLHFFYSATYSFGSIESNLFPKLYVHLSSGFYRLIRWIQYYRSPLAGALLGQSRAALGPYWLTYYPIGPWRV